jgi:microsomal dipeptidase-like Zn-dependent dipeptidase
VRSVQRDEDHAINIIDPLLAKEIDGVRAPLSLLIDNIDYVEKSVGFENVGLDSDFGRKGKTHLERIGMGFCYIFSSASAR